MGSQGSKFKEREVSDSPLSRAQTMIVTASGLPICQKRTRKILTRKELEKMKRKSTLSPDIRIILNPPFALVDRITDSLYLTGVGGLIMENVRTLNITCIINATYEMPLASIDGIESFRVPVDDDPSEDIFPYFDDVATKIYETEKKGGRTVVHCMAGASRSSSLVIAYLIKYQDFTLKNAFCYLKSLRACARPNIGFFEQLIKYEEFYRDGVNSTKIAEYKIDDKKVRVPDFYRTTFPDLYKTEVNKQLYRSHLSQIVLQQSNKNYMNRKRNYKDIQRDMDNLRDGAPTKSQNPDKDKNDKDKNEKDKNDKEKEKDK